MKKNHLLPLFLLFLMVANGQNTLQSYITEPAKFNKSLLQNTVSGLAKDEDGMLWAISQYGCYRYDGYNTKIYLTNNTPFLTSDRYRALFNDNDKKRLIVIGDNDYYFIRDRRLKEKSNADSVAISSNYNFLLVPKSKTHQLINQNQTLCKASILFFKTDTILLADKISLNFSKNCILPYNLLNAKDKENLISKNGQVFTLNKTGLLELFWNGEKIISKLKSPIHGFTHIIPSNDKNFIWIENENEIIKINQFSGKIISGFLKPQNIKFSASIFEDPESGTIYLGTVKKGVLSIRLNAIHKLAEENYTSSYCFNNKLNSLTIAAINGIAFFSKNDHKTIYWPQKDMLALYIFSDQQNRIWYQNNHGKILILNPSTRKIEDSLSFDDFMVSLNQLDEENFLISNHSSTFKLHLKTKTFSPVFQTKTKESIFDVCFFNNQLYISTNNGLYVLDADNKIISHLLSGVPIRKTIKLNKNTLAIGSYGRGFYLMKNNKVYQASTDKYPQLSAVASLSLDADGALWVLCNKGAFVWKQPEVINEKLTPPDYVLLAGTDLPCDELNGGLNPDTFPNNQIVLPSSDGLLVFNKKDLISTPTNDKITLAEVLLDDSIINSSSSFTVPPGKKQLTFIIDQANLAYNSKLTSQYRLKELDSNWTSLPETRTIDFSRLPKGKYQLECRKNPNDFPIVLASFQVLPYWYETPWVMIAIFILTIGMMYLILKIRIQNQKLYQKKLETIIEEKTKTLKEKNVQLKASEKELKKQYRHRNKLYSILMHDLKSPLTFLSTYSIQQLSQNKVVDKDAMKVIAKSSSELSSFINEFLFWLGKQSQQEMVRLVKTNVSELLYDLTSFYENFASINNNRIFYFDKHKNIIFKTDPDRLKIIIRNLLDNANKYTDNGIIKINCSIDLNNCLLISIEDSGKGLPENIAALVNNPGKTSEIEASINANHKMGLLISKELAGQLNGTISVSSDENTGTVFTLRFCAET